MGVCVYVWCIYMNVPVHVLLKIKLLTIGITQFEDFSNTVCHVLKISVVESNGLMGLLGLTQQTFHFSISDKCCSVCVCVCVCVLACVRACMQACVRARMHVCV